MDVYMKAGMVFLFAGVGRINTDKRGFIDDWITHMRKQIGTLKVKKLYWCSPRSPLCFYTP